MSIEAMKQALDALYDIEATGVPVGHIDLVIDTLRTAIEHTEKQEPVAWRYRSVSPFVGKDGTYKVSDGWTLIRKPEKRDAHSAMCGMEAEPLYTTPPQRTWVGLTDNEIALINADYPHPQGFAKAIEAKLKEKNT